MWRYKSQRVLFLGWVFVLWRGRETKGEYGIEGGEGERKEGKGKREGRKGKIRRDGVEGGGEQRGREERGLKGSEEERKRSVRVWWFWGNPPPRRLLTQGVRVFCGVVQLLRSSFFNWFYVQTTVYSYSGRKHSALILFVEGDFSHRLSMETWLEFWLGCRNIG